MCCQNGSRLTETKGPQCQLNKVLRAGWMMEGKKEGKKEGELEDKV